MISILFLISDFGTSAVGSEVYYYVVPWLNATCGYDSCLTLSLFASISTSDSFNETGISLFLLPGNHSLDRELSLTLVQSISIVKVAQEETVTVECTNQLARFRISETANISIQGLHFIGCANNSLTLVEHFLLFDAIFQGLEGYQRGRALTLVGVRSATIANTTFTHNSDGGVMYMQQSSLDITNSTFIKNRAAANGGVLVAINSSFIIVSSTFTNNIASSGGIFFTHMCSFNVIESIFSGNNATWYGGVAVAIDSSFNIISSTFSNNTAVIYGGVMVAIHRKTQSTFAIFNSMFIYNRAVTNKGGVVFTTESSFSIIASEFTSNTATTGGVLFVASRSVFVIINSTFKDNIATQFGGVMVAINVSFTITTSNFTNNCAEISGVIQAHTQSSFSIIDSTFTNNIATEYGGILYTSRSSFTITGGKFRNNRAGTSGGVLYARSNFLSKITSSVFTNNSPGPHGGVIDIIGSVFNFTGCIFTENHAISHISGVVITEMSILTVSNSTFNSNSAPLGGGIITALTQFSLNITNCTFTDNSAVSNGVGGGVLLIGTSYLNSATIVTLVNSTFHNNLGGIMNAWGASTHIVNGKFDSNWGSLVVFSSNVTFSGVTEFKNSVDIPDEIDVVDSGLHGGALTSFKSNIIFTGVNHLTNNQARYGGAISATDSRITVCGEMIIVNNTAIIGPGGGIFLQKSVFDINGKCIINNNVAVRGAGIYATSSTINIYVPGILQIINNMAQDQGGGIYFEIDPKLNLLKPPGNADNLLIFANNYAGHAGGAIFVNDYKNSALCSSGSDCFIQVLGISDEAQTGPGPGVRSLNVFFSDNIAAIEELGSNLYGGILDRCISSEYASVLAEDHSQYAGLSYLERISNITVDSVTSRPLKLCFCTTQGQPDCQYQPPPIRVKRGETFTVPLIAIDQVYRIIGTSINSSLAFPNSGFAEGQQTQTVNTTCTELTFNVYSSEDKEMITLYADGPCGSSTSSTRHVDVHFLNCTCPIIGFQPSNNSPTRCDCTCDSVLLPYIMNCNYTANLLLRETNSWIAYTNDTDPPGFVISPDCPFDYCHPQSAKINFSLPSGVDRQCAHDRVGVLCGACKQNFSLSLGSSRCFPCPSHWPAVFMATLLASIIAGALLVTWLAIFNVTVVTGLINGIIFYANIIAAIRRDVLFGVEPTFPSIFIAWLNLDVGFDFCFLNGLDMYTKTWLQLAFPVYIITLFIIVTNLSKCLPRFSYLIRSERGDAVLATLILLSYTKLLSLTVAILSFTVLHYPDGSSAMVWLLDGSVQYLQGKHVALVVVAVMIMAIGVPYTFFVFLWQWLSDEKLLELSIKNAKIRSAVRKLLRWMMSTKLNDIITKYDSPLNVKDETSTEDKIKKHHYWTGLLLLVRVVLYITAAITNSGNPQLPLLMTMILIGGLFFLKAIIGTRLYGSTVVDTIETVTLLNLLTFTTFSLYRFNSDNIKQMTTAYVSTLLTFLILIGVVVYQIYLTVKKMAVRQNLISINELGTHSPINEVTYSIVEISRPPSPLPEANWKQTNVDSDNEDCQSKTAPCDYHKNIEDTDDSYPLLDESHQTA